MLNIIYPKLLNFSTTSKLLYRNLSFTVFAQYKVYISIYTGLTLTHSFLYLFYCPLVLDQLFQYKHYNLHHTICYHEAFYPHFYIYVRFRYSSAYIFFLVVRKRTLLEVLYLFNLYALRCPEAFRNLLDYHGI